MRSIPNTFYHSEAWKACKNAYLKEKRYLCERCLAKGIITRARIVHHKIYLTEDNYLDESISLNTSNLECLCIECHNKEHNNKKERRYQIREDGSIVV